MSMQYHRYIRFELEERKGERKRLRERAAERKAKRDAVLTSTATVAAKSPAKEPKDVVLPGGWKAAAVQPQSKPKDVADEAVEDPYLADDQYGADVQDQADPLMAAAVAATASSAKSSAVSSPPDLTEAEKKVFEALKRAEMELGPDAPLSPPHESDLLEKPSAKDMSDIAMLLQEAGVKSAPRAESPPPKRARAATSSAPAPAPAPTPVVDLEDDLYGDIVGPTSNKAAATSSYASKIGSMLNADDFDEDE